MVSYGSLAQKHGTACILIKNGIPLPLSGDPVYRLLSVPVSTFFILSQHAICRRASDLTHLDSDKRLIAGYHERAEVLIGLISERDAAISALEYEVRRLTIELQKQTKVGALGLAGGRR